jgi:hypothetical protein
MYLPCVKKLLFLQKKNEMKIATIIGIILSLSITAVSQNITPVDIKYFNPDYADGRIKFSQDRQLENYFESYAGLNKKRRGFYGYRVKVFAQNNAAARNQANSIRISFEESQKDHKAYVVYVEPNFEVHVGDFTNRFEAVAFLNKIYDKYPEAYIIKTIITYPKY